MNRLVMQDALRQAEELACGGKKLWNEPEQIIIRAREALDALEKELAPEEEPLWRFRDEKGLNYRITPAGDLQVFIEARDEWDFTWIDEVTAALVRDFVLTEFHLDRRARQFAETLKKITRATDHHGCWDIAGDALRALELEGIVEGRET